MPKAQNAKNQTLTLIRGLPGSGKSTLAAHLASATDAVHLEADMFMVDRQGFYDFDIRRLKQTHAKCEAQCREALEDGRNVVISNTFTRFWEMKAYIDMAKHLDVPLQIVECHARFGSIHQVPDETLEDMRDRWEDLPAEYR
ncbi:MULTISPECIES: ATP-binding protein [Thalassospira]|uniref:ATPase AAA n=2 Tax=Thalassospira TaxID=168934 RepID=A0A367WD32_9PROT|nr:MULTISPECIES: ATP-binding protein [Thalassospira]MDG4720055.1 ATP-binding protein [Thalassospira sp. FZY0004]RCK38491.1 ATPase AAA [Thalassospira profundimaris]